MKHKTIQYLLVCTVCMLFLNISQAHSATSEEVVKKTPQKNSRAAQGQMIVNTGMSAQKMWKALYPGELPPGVTIDSISRKGKKAAFGTYSNMSDLRYFEKNSSGNGFNTDDTITSSVNDGIIISSGMAAEVASPNPFGQNTSLNVKNGTIGNYKPFQELVPGIGFDEAIFTIEFTTDTRIDGITLHFVFASEEFPVYVKHKYVGSNDAGGVFLDDINIAYDPNGNPITVDNDFLLVNNTPGVGENDFQIFNSYYLTHPEEYPPYISSVNMGYNGCTPLLRTSVKLEPGTHTLRFGVSEEDGLWDCGIFVNNLKFKYSGDGTVISKGFFVDHTFTIDEKVPADTLVGILGTLLLDETDVEYTIISNEHPEFTLNSQTGEIRVSQSADFNPNIKDEYIFEVEAKASDLKDRDTATVIIRVIPEVKEKAEIQEAILYDADGDGIGDSLYVTLQESISVITPELIELQWPKGNSSIDIAVDNTNLKYGRFLPISFEPADKNSVLTTGVGEVTISFNSNGQKQERVADVKDGIGPVLMSAVLYERVGSGNDTMSVTFSEEVKTDIITGKSFVLHKQNGSLIDLSLIDTATDISGNTTITFAINDLGSNKPKAGDSLSILSIGPVEDLCNNSAHKNNRPVILSLLKRPPTIIDAKYLDENADGIVDLALITFDKSLEFDDEKISFTFTWVDENSSGWSDQFSYPYDDDKKTIAVKIESIFSKTHTDKTSGKMTLTAKFDNYNTTIEHYVNDRAAPVIIKATFMFNGKIVDPASNSSDDTLIIKFSEPVKEINSKSPFVLNTKDNEMENYYFNVKTIDHDNDRVIFIVESINGKTYPKNMDQIHIDFTTDVSDTKSNKQKCENNKRVDLIVVIPPYKLEVLVGNNPFTPGVDKIPEFIASDINVMEYGIVIKVAPDKVIGDIELNDIKVKIYDHAGNLAVQYDGFTDVKPNIKSVQINGSLYVIWNGTNGSGKVVGTGAYIAFLDVIDNNDNSKKVQLFIGIKK